VSVIAIFYGESNIYWLGGV